MSKIIIPVILIALFLPYYSEAALTFGLATSDRVQVATNASINNLSAITVCGWFYPTTLTYLRTLVSKRSTTVGWSLIFAGTSGDIQ